MMAALRRLLGSMDAVDADGCLADDQSDGSNDDDVCLGDGC